MKIDKQSKREARQLFRLCLVNDVLDRERAREVARQVGAAGQRHGPAVLAHLLRLVKLETARETAHIESAGPLEPDLRIAIQAGLARRYGRVFTTTYDERPSLIGGVRIQVASDVFDGSVRARLEALRKSF